MANRRGNNVVDFELKPRFVTPGNDDVSRDMKKIQKDLEKVEKEQAAFDNIVSTFEKTLKREKKSLKRKNQKLTDSTGNIAVLKAMLQMTLKLIPTAEKMYHKYKNERAAYAVVALVNKGIEISADIQRLGGAASAAPVIINTILMPNFQHLLQNTLNEGSVTIRALKDKLPDKYHRIIQDVVNSSIKNQTNYMGEVNLAISEKIEKYYNEK